MHPEVTIYMVDDEADLDLDHVHHLDHLDQDDANLVMELFLQAALASVQFRLGYSLPVSSPRIVIFIFISMVF